LRNEAAAATAIEGVTESERKRLKCVCGNRAPLKCVISNIKVIKLINCLAVAPTFTKKEFFEN